MFPPTDPRWRDADSLDLLKRAYLRVVEAGLSFVSADITVIIEQPKLARYLDDMRENLAGALVSGFSTVSVKAKTNEGMGWIGKGEGVPVLAHIEVQYQRHGTYGIFVSRLLPVWRAVVPPFAGIAGLSAPRALIPLALASALWYGLLTVLIASLGTNLDAVVAALAHVNWVLGAAALGILIFLAVWIVRRLKR